MRAPSHLRSSHLRSSYPISSHLHHICASSDLRSLFQIFTSSLSPSGFHFLKPHLVSASSDLHHVVALSYLIIFKISSCNYYCKFTTWYMCVFKTSSPRSRANRRLVQINWSSKNNWIWNQLTFEPIEFRIFFLLVHHVWTLPPPPCAVHMLKEWAPDMYRKYCNCHAKWFQHNPSKFDDSLTKTSVSSPPKEFKNTKYGACRKNPIVRSYFGEQKLSTWKNA